MPTNQGPKYIQEYKTFSVDLLKEKGSKCYFCNSEDNVWAFYMLTSKLHKKEKLFNNPQKKIFYYPACQHCMQVYAKARDKFLNNISIKGVPVYQADEYLANKINNFISVFPQGDVTSFNNFIDDLKNGEIDYVPNYDDDPVVQILPSVAAQLSQNELNLAISRIKKYQEEFLFNSSSDYIILLNLVLQEIRLQRLMEKLLGAKKDNPASNGLQKEYTELNKDYRENLQSLGILRRERDKIGGVNIAEISEIIGDENQTRLEVQNWDDEMEKMLEQKAKRDKKLGVYDEGS